MSNVWFFEKFELIADLPDAVSRMRENGLELAFQGAFQREINSEVTEFGGPSDFPVGGCLDRHRNRR